MKKLVFVAATLLLAACSSNPTTPVETTKDSVTVDSINVLDTSFVDTIKIND